LTTWLLIRRVRLDICQVSADSRSRGSESASRPAGVAVAGAGPSGCHLRLLRHPHQPRCVHPGQSHRGTVLGPASHEHRNVFRDSKHGAALRHPPSEYAEINTAWMWGALLATSMAAWLHQLTATEHPSGHLTDWGARGQNNDRHPAPPPKSELRSACRPVHRVSDRQSKGLRWLR
jgi:hypothetical protein